MYKVIVRFMDMQDSNYVYNVGDVFPREGVVVDEGRLKELSSSRNRRREPLIRRIEEASSLTEEAPLESEAGETPSNEEKAEKKPRRGKKSND